MGNKKKGKKKYSTIGLEHFPLKGDLDCGYCSQKLVANYAKGRSKNYPYYRCDSSQEVCSASPKNIRRDVIHDDFIKLLKQAGIRKEVLKLADQIIEDISDAVKSSNGVNDVEIITTFDPPFGPDMMSEDAKMILGLF